MYIIKQNEKFLDRDGNFNKIITCGDVMIYGTYANAFHVHERMVEAGIVNVRIVKLLEAIVK